MPAGDYNVTVKFDGDDFYNSAENSTIFNIVGSNDNVTKLNTVVRVVVNNTVCGENITGTITLNTVNGTKLKGKVNIVINGTSYRLLVWLTVLEQLT